MMNTAFAHERSLDRASHPVPTVAETHRLSAIDRLSLRLGLWLLLRSTRRIHRIRDHEDHARALAVQRAREARDATSLHHHTRAFGA